MNKLPNFWQTVEALRPAYCDVPLGWQKRVGGEYARITPLLRPNGRISECYRCPFDWGCLSAHYVVEHRNGDFSAIPDDDSRDRCRVVEKLQREDVALQEVDMRAVWESVATVLGIQPLATAIPLDAACFQLGNLVPHPGRLFPVHVALSREPGDFLRAVQSLALTLSEPFVLLAPTANWCGQESDSVLRMRKTLFLPLSEYVGLDDEGNWVAEPAPKELFAAFLADAAPDLRAEQQETEQENVFRLDGAAWTMGYAGETVHLPDTKGFRYVALLLANPGKAWRIEDLYLSAGNGAAVSARHGLDIRENGLYVTGVAADGSEEIIDARARQEYKERLHRIDTEMDDARCLGDTERLGSLELERDGIVEELARVIGHKGRTRKAGSGADRLRIAITKNVGRAIEVISARHPALGRHLDNSIQTGYTVAYRPERSVHWQT